VSTEGCPPGHGRAGPLAARCARHPDPGRTVSRSEPEGLVEALRARMATPEATVRYRLRRQTVELVNADGKAHRGRRRSGRGLRRAEAQVGLCGLGPNRLTLHSERRKASSGKATAPTADTPKPGQDTT
jgi:hypothetical protein